MSPSPPAQPSRDGPARPPGVGVRWLLAAAVAVVLASSLPARQMPGQHQAAEAVRIYTALAVVEHGTFCLNPVYDRFFAGWDRMRRSPNPDASVVEGCYVQDKAPLLALAAIPVVAVLHAAGEPGGYAGLARWLALLLVTFPALGLVLLARSRLRSEGLAPPAAVDAGLALMLVASPMLASLGHFSSHAVVGPLVLLGCLLSLGAGEAGRARLRWGVGGLCLGLAVLLEYPAALLVVVAVCAALVDPGTRSRVPWIVLGGLGPLLALLGWNTIVFGGPFELSYAHKANPQFRAVHEQGFFGLAALRWEAIWGLTFGSRRGLVFHAPWVLAAVWGYGFVVRDRAVSLRWRVMFGVGVPVYVLAVFTFVDWEAGAWMGARHLLCVLPLVGLLVARALSEWSTAKAWGSLALVGVAGAAGYAVVLNVAATNVFPHYPEGLVHPFAVLIAPILLEAGPSPTVFPRVVGAWPGFVLQLVAALGLVYVSLRALGSCRSAGGASIAWPSGRGALLSLMLCVGLLALAAWPRSLPPQRELQVLRQKDIVYGAWGHDALQQSVRNQLREAAETRMRRRTTREVLP